MKSRLIFLLLILPAISHSQKSSFDVLHYRYELELSDKSDTVAGSAAITFMAKEDLSEISLDLESLHGSKGMKMISLETRYWTSKPKEWVHENDKLTIPVYWHLKKGDTATVLLYYKGIPADGLIIAKNKYGKRTFFADNWPNRAHHWIPCKDDPADKATVEFIVTAPSHYQVVSNGLLIEETNLPGDKKLTHYREDVPLPTKVMVIGVADFAVNLAGEVGCIPVYSWVYPEERKNGFYDYTLAKDILSYYINYIGPYPYKKLANVQSKTIFGGMENAGAIFYHENSVDGKRSEEYLYAHEIVHQWFGDMATEKSYPHLWLSEGFATYLTHVYAESKLGSEAFNERMKNDRSEVIDFVNSSPKPVVDPVTPARQLLNPNSYQRGSWVLHMLRRQLGDSVFHLSVRTYYDMYKGANADTKDLQNVFEQISKKNLDTFFRQWLYTPVIPKLGITWKYDEKEKNVVITVKQLQKGGAFSFPLDLFIQEASQMPFITTLSITKDSQTFTFPVKNKLLSLKIDPFVSLLFDGTIIQVK